jgi:hypothetical protein
MGLATVSRASLKEKPFYDEAMHELLYTTLLDKEQANSQVFMVNPESLKRALRLLRY